MNWYLLFAATVAHYIGDYPLQGDFLGVYKAKHDYLLFCHSLIWAGCICIPLAYFGVFAWWKVAYLLVGHFIIDRIKARKPDKTDALTWDLWRDQLAHFLQVIQVTII